MFISITIILFVVSFIMALRSIKTVNEKPGIKEVKKSLDKSRVIYQSHSESSE